MRYYDFVDKSPALGSLVVIEGTERLFSDRAIVAIENRLLDPATRDLNLERFSGAELESMEPVEAACATLPFLGNARVVVVRDAQLMRVAPRRSLWEVAERAPKGNTLVIEDLQSPLKKSKPETFGQLAGRAALRIDTTAGQEARARFVRETLAELGASAEPAVLNAIAAAGGDLASARTDLEKLALLGHRITLDDLVQESLVNEDVKAYKVASALVEGRASYALALAYDMIAADGQRAATPLFAAIAAEYRLVWEFARPNGVVPSQFRWRERYLRPVAARLGERRARLGYERAVRAFEAAVTGRSEEPRAVLAVLATVANTEGRDERGLGTTGPR
jgi:DNA polymerase III delta subunit